MSTLIDLDRLCAPYIAGEEFGPTDYPDLFRVVVDDVQWITDRRWMLRHDVILCVGWPDDITDLTGKNLDAAQGWIRAMLTGHLRDCDQRFLPCFAGVLTEAGVRARSMTDQPWSVLMDAAGERIGLLMPYVEHDDYPGLPIPVPNDIVVLAQKIGNVPTVGLDTAGRVAAHLASKP